MAFLKSLRLIVLIIVIQPALAANHVLFNARGKPTPGYEETVARLRSRPFDTVQFSDGTRRTVVRVLGAGGTTIVFENELGRASRIPKTIRDREYIDQTAEAYPALKAAGAPILTLYPATHIAAEHVEVDLLPPDSVSLEDWVIRYERCYLNPDACGKPTLKEYKRRYGALVRFLAAFAPFKRIRDFNSSQIHWTGSAWILTDWVNDFSGARNVNDRHEGLVSLWEPLGLKNDFMEEVEAAVWARRTALASRGLFPCRALLIP